jgi:signal transduction histidine kinase
MTLRCKMIYQIGAMIVGLVLLAIAPLWGIVSLHEDFGGAVRGFHELRDLYEVGQWAASTKVAIMGRHSELASISWPRNTPSALAPFLQEAAAAFQKSHGRLPTDAEYAEQIGALNRIVVEVLHESDQIEKRISAKESDAQTHRLTTMVAVAALGAVVVGVSVLLGVAQYFGVIGPLRQLGQSVRQIAAGSFANRIEMRSSAEFAALADDFNRMAQELDSLYRDLEQKVALKSRELVRSERLASVGYLAAGVAHEINNPLGIIAGYAERSLAGMEEEPTDAGLRKALQTICSEAFRCKEITGKLLSMARGAEEEKRLVNLAAVARDVVSTVGTLRPEAGKKMAIAPADDAARLGVLARAGEMKQVMLNLFLNALDAIDGVAGGKVDITVRRQGRAVELCVEDNGRGMTGQTLERIFEPFYTEKRGDRGQAGKDDPRRGTGLGLSITHAIVLAHGGRIQASSPGLGQGSRLVVELPAAPEGGASMFRCGGH